ncbi:aldehyde reductase [Aspergillus eucalypticola CBS 122712]|uniref:Aldehyde reductase n=1 Tax=Aspergillus eucalypticola (strain CBS 122712 / IBT 29274) TaxID=1448314 RepID=A0A317UX46_ASPEC|nr:aldehyde reductase [Aspergillus eucalypticola CBS 122712]PWY65891.1 aldehyde reductase [Aspergillus eucalypticola CBS 122712]
MTISETSAIPHGSWVLVTGANSLVGSNVADRLLSRGYRVRGTVRNAQRHQWLGDLFRDKYGKDSFELVQIQDIQRPGAFGEAMKGVSGVAHVVTIFAGSNDSPDEVFESIKQLDYNILASAAAEPSVKRFVYTSSCQAANTMGLDDLDGKTVITSETWNETAIQRAKTGSPAEWRRGFDVYSASKALGEQGIWEWVREHKPRFVANTVLPSLCYGASLDPQNQGFPSTLSWPAAIIKNDWASVSEHVKANLPNGGYCVDIQDAALLHVAALINPTVQNERLFAYGWPFFWNDLATIYRDIFPNRELPTDLPARDKDADLLDVKPSKRSEDLLKEMGKPGWSSLKEIVVANAYGLV